MDKEKSLTVKDLSLELASLLSEDVRTFMSMKKEQLMEPGVYEIRYVEILYKAKDEEKALKTMAKKLEMIYEKYGIVGSMLICISMDLVGPEGLVAPPTLSWDYLKDPIGPGTLGWGKTEEEIEELRDRKLLISYPAIPWDKLFTPEGELPKNLDKC